MIGMGIIKVYGGGSGRPSDYVRKVKTSSGCGCKGILELHTAEKERGGGE